MNTFYQLKITLLWTDPAVWRRVVVPASLSLDRLHDVIQIVMGWVDAHLRMSLSSVNIYRRHSGL
ncbi:IS1096 element passenger TnpR family protein [Sulfurivirga caldicuralii]|uniref:IS1096 element passenger TnpR family protein n=1 Tax=Sulfurivirga caldicuralii TaxID=364032 RepID=UPI0009FE8410